MEMQLLLQSHLAAHSFAALPRNRLPSRTHVSSKAPPENWFVERIPVSLRQLVQSKHSDATGLKVYYQACAGCCAR
eukprot:4004232-Amphidinium_carterae.1